MIALEQVEDGISSVPPFPTQQFTEGNYGIPQQQLIFSPEATYLSQQQRAHQVITQQSVQPITQQSVQLMVQQPVQPMLQSCKVQWVILFSLVRNCLSCLPFVVHRAKD